MNNVRAALVRLIIFVVVGVLGIFALLAIFAQFRFQPTDGYQAHFSNVTGLENGNFVRIAGVEVGKVTKIAVQSEGHVAVDFTVDKSVVLTGGSRAAIRYDNLIGGRYLALEEGAGSTTRLQPGETIPLANTSPALDLDSLIGGFKPLFRALDPDQVNELTGQLIRAFQGEGDTIASFLNQTASVTSTLADRDELVGEVITNLNTVLTSISDQSDQLDKTVTSLSTLVGELANRRTDVTVGLAYANEAGRTLSDLLAVARPPLQETVAQTDRVATLAAADSAYLDNLIGSLPDKYRVLARQGIYGDYFSFYLCDLILKLNGKGGEPVYIKVASQTTGRCAPR